MATLTRELRRSLESTVRAARRVAEAGARKVIEQLAVHHHEPWPSMTPVQRELRNRLRAHGRQLGDRRDERRGVQAIDHLTTEFAYEHWHRMLFARFLAETELLIEPESGVAISLAECQELARAVGRDWLEVAAEYAQRMLPHIFRSGDPVLEVALPPETRSELEDLMKALPSDVFLADDSLGWVYQYWQADLKEAINHSEKKIGAEELPAVTQLFTEDYMVLFLLHNTLGAWWAGKVLAANPDLAATAHSEDELRSACSVGDVEWTYLRFVREMDQPWCPAAGTFRGWPKTAKDITLLDPCMGSGHFLVFALPMLAALREAEEGIAPQTATLAVLHANLFGLEIDPRCTQIAAFNLALAAWRRVGYRALPALHLACSGLSLGVNKTDWLKLAERAAAELPVPPNRDLLGSEDNLFSAAMRRGFERLYDLFARAPWLGSLIDPRVAGGDLVESGFADLEPILVKVMSKAESAELSEMAVAAQGIAKAAEILSRNFTLVATNVPYLGRGKQDIVLKDYCEDKYSEAKADLATCFVERCLAYCQRGSTVALVTPVSWWYIQTYSGMRKALSQSQQVNVLVGLGPAAFDDMNWWAAQTGLSIISNDAPNKYFGGDASSGKGAEQKRLNVSAMSFSRVPIESVRRETDYRLTIDELRASRLLSDHADVFVGLQNGDSPQFLTFFWEVVIGDGLWDPFQLTNTKPGYFGGREGAIFWEQGQGKLVSSEGFYLKGREAWGRKGIIVRQMNVVPSLYFGEKYDQSSSVIVPREEGNLLPIYCFLESEEYKQELKKLDPNFKITNSTMTKVPFDLLKWRLRAEKAFADGFPEPHCNDPTQWLFNAHPKESEAPLQVAVARLVGYRWPRQAGTSFPECPSLESDGLEKHADRDGIVTLSPVKGEQPASRRLTALLADALGADWSAAKMDNMLALVGHAGKTLDDWLRDAFFEQHCTLFHQRPFVWHVWDGRRDGFHALVNYHRLAAPNGEGRRTLEKLLYTYLGDWIDRQRSDQQAGVEGADARVAAAERLRVELANILAGEPPYDLFVRWKPLAEQPIGWEPDISDGVRMNIRPFVAAKPMGVRAKGACILRTMPKVKWEKDRGKEPQRSREDFPWLWGWDESTDNFVGAKVFDGNRWNELHHTRSFKEAARARSKK
jgi:hypothetical protein